MRALTAIVTALYTALVPGALAIALPWAILAGRGDAPAAAAWRQAGWLLVAVGALLVLRCAYELVVSGRGTPAPVAPPTALIGSGLFRWTRNPMYLGLVLAVLGEALVFWSAPLLLDALAMWAVMQAFLLLYEEPSLRRRFGQAYDDYRARVPRWLGLPRGR